MTKPKIIVVDDQPQIGVLLANFLTKKNYAVTSFIRPDEALRHLKTNTVDLMLTDLEMPEMSGIALIQAARTLKPDLPILLMTGTPDAARMPELANFGIGDYLAKPFSLQTMEKAIASRLARNQSAVAGRERRRTNVTD